jgi:Lanthionine synthetase C-like protein
VDQALLPQMAQQAQRLSDLAPGMSSGEFDVISGLAGVGSYLLCRTESDAASTALDVALRALVALVADDGDRPKWWTPPGLMGNENMAAQYPHGNLNCGLAHGIRGISRCPICTSHRPHWPRISGYCRRSASLDVPGNRMGPRPGSARFPDVRAAWTRSACTRRRTCSKYIL